MARGEATCYAAGTIDDVRIYSRALSATDVMRLYNSGAAATIQYSRPQRPTTGAIGLGRGGEHTLRHPRHGGRPYRDLLGCWPPHLSVDDPATTFTQSSIPYKEVSTAPSSPPTGPA